MPVDRCLRRDACGQMPVKRCLWTGAECGRTTPASRLHREHLSTSAAHASVCCFDSIPSFKLPACLTRPAAASVPRQPVLRLLLRFNSFLQFIQRLPRVPAQAFCALLNAKPHDLKGKDLSSLMSQPAAFLHRRWLHELEGQPPGARPPAPSCRAGALEREAFMSWASSQLTGKLEG
jgi:hypothetical protein